MRGASLSTTGRSKPPVVSISYQKAPPKPSEGSLLRMGYEMGRLLRKRVPVARAGNRGIGRTEQAGGIRLPQPGVQIVVMQRQWNQRFMSFHGAIERLAKD